MFLVKLLFDTPFLLLLFFVSVVQSISNSQEPVQSSNASLLWGPYRPNLYLGVRPRIPNSILTGLMWANADDPLKIAEGLRHTCEQNEGMEGYGWESYDVRYGGRQVINDTGNKINLITEFAKIIDDKGQYTGQWGVRVRGTGRKDAKSLQKTTLVFYVAVEDSASMINFIDSRPGEMQISGTTPEINAFTIRLTNSTTTDFRMVKQAVVSLNVPSETLWQAKSIFTDLLRSSGSLNGLIAHQPAQGNLHFLQAVFEGSFELDVLYSPSHNRGSMTSSLLAKAIDQASLVFDRGYRTAYMPREPFSDESYTKFSRSLLSNPVGGIGYFYGTSIVDVANGPNSIDTGETVSGSSPLDHSHQQTQETGPYALFTSVPSRPFFPRGFLWDEGFHLQVILDYDMDLALDIVSSWLDLMDENGWIAREQILGPEARSKVPAEFQTQYQDYANPPTLFLVIEAFLKRLQGEVAYNSTSSQHCEDVDVGTSYLRSIYPKLKKHYEWFRRTQIGSLTRYQQLSNTTSFNLQGYRWRGRTPGYCLTSGLDDYPRAEPPHAEELHVDALSWVGSMASILSKIATYINEPVDIVTFSTHLDDISQSIDIIHWSQPDQAYCDTTIDPQTNKIKHICHKGYVSLLPFILGFILPTHPNFKTILNFIHDPNHLWTPYGLRSLSAQDPNYKTGENYWRSPIWININYMVIVRLAEVYNQTLSADLRQQIREIYTELRINIVNTVYNSWLETGFAWEQYNPDDGRGQRTQHFTGWTALVVKIMAMPEGLKDSFDLHNETDQSGHDQFGQSTHLPLSNSPTHPLGRYEIFGYSYKDIPLSVMVLVSGTLVLGLVFRRRMTRTLLRSGLDTR